MGKGFYPDHYVKSAYTIDYEKLWEQGIRGLIFDIDNTLVYPNAPADERSIRLFEQLHGIGFKTCILSNNTGKRISTFAEEVHSPYLTGAAKPFPGKYLEAMRSMDCDLTNTVFIGDQLFTDIWGANNAHMISYLTEPLTDKEEFWIVWKRRLEKKVLKGVRKDFT